MSSSGDMRKVPCLVTLWAIRASSGTRFLFFPVRLLHDCRVCGVIGASSEQCLPPGARLLGGCPLFRPAAFRHSRSHALFTGAWPAAGVPAGLNHRGPPSPMCSTGTSPLSPKSRTVGQLPVTDGTISLAGTVGEWVQKREKRESFVTSPDPP